MHDGTYDANLCMRCYARSGLCKGKRDSFWNLFDKSRVCKYGPKITTLLGSWFGGMHVAPQNVDKKPPALIKLALNKELGV